jgi:tRNA/tmRNA/rRNA uracil-C5-methylase (TrmA/RlmC/RlmD family)
LGLVPKLVSIWKKSPSGPARCLAGKPVLTIQAGAGTLEVGGGVFTQVNEEAGGLLREYVLAKVAPADGMRVVDAYCGPGTWGRGAAGLGATVTGIDLLPGGQDDQEGAKGGSYRSVVGLVEEQLEGFLPADVVILNPPREGLKSNVPPVLLEHRPPRLIYVSCDPATLGRDLSRLADVYSLVDLQAFDLFPQTGHVETVACLEAGTS